MKRLTLVRHGKSSWRDPGRDDFDRPLNKRGKHDAPLMGKRLAARESRPELLLSSPARRARQTAKLLCWALELPEERLILVDGIYEAGSETLLDVVRSLDDCWQHALLVGHNPGITELGNLLADCGIEHFPTCGVLCLDFAVEVWTDVAPGAGYLVFFDYPKKHFL
jgi:phosphohistidine phosphatase